MFTSIKTKMENSLRESIAGLISMFSIPLPKRARKLMTYEDYHEWKEAYYLQHKNHPVEAGEAHGRAFCQAHLIHDKELEASENRIRSETIILSRYVDRNRVLN